MPRCRIRERYRSPANGQSLSLPPLPLFSCWYNGNFFNMLVPVTIQRVRQSGWLYFFPLCFAAIGMLNLYEYVGWVLTPFLLSMTAIVFASQMPIRYGS